MIKRKRKGLSPISYVKEYEINIQEIKEVKKEQAKVIVNNTVFSVQACAVVRTLDEAYLCIVTQTQTLIKMYSDEVTICRLERKLNKNLTVDLTESIGSLRIYSLM